MIPRGLLNRYDSTETLIGRCMIPRELLRHIHCYYYYQEEKFFNELMSIGDD